ncbi:MAG: hypothetical protein C0478_14130 [Planctomyces sp.]|nr:hypothetical protein [Planctomyces sp.]
MVKPQEIAGRRVLRTPFEIFVDSQGRLSVNETSFAAADRSLTVEQPTPPRETQQYEHIDYLL